MRTRRGRGQGLERQLEGPASPPVCVVSDEDRGGYLVAAPSDPHPDVAVGQLRTSTGWELTCP
jgi:hypothetical protein